jgi:subtilisin family serine protease
LPHPFAHRSPLASSLLAAGLALILAWLAPVSTARADDGIARVPVPPTAWAGPPVGTEPPAPVTVADQLIIQFTHDLPEAARAALLQERGLHEVQPLGLIDATVVASPHGAAHAAEALAGHPHVAYAEPVYERRPDVDYAAEPYIGQLWGLNNSGQTVNGYIGAPDADINGPEAASITLGSPTVVVAVIDSGVDFSHPDLAGQQWVNPGESGADLVGGNRATNGLDDDLNGYVDDVNGWDFCNNDRTVFDPNTDAHGTHVASTIAASLNGAGIVGVAPGVRIMSLKFMQGAGCGTDAQAIAAIQYAASKGVRIINASWGGAGFSLSLKTAIESSGALFVAAAGNSGVNNDTHANRAYPASYDSANIISVAAIHNEGALASFSNYGPTTVDVSAPGEFILGAVPPLAGAPAGWGYYSGTSMAAPHVSGVAALVGSTQPALLGIPTALRGHLLATAKAASATLDLTATGRMIDAYRALIAPQVVRQSGANRYATAAEATRPAFLTHPYYVFVATGENFPDALAGAATAAVLGSPLVLVRPDDIPAESVAELNRLRPQEILVLGGPGAVSPTVEMQLNAWAPVTRLYGANRYATAAAISAGLDFPAGVPVVYIATGENFPDALAGVPAAGQDGGPLLLVNAAGIPPETGAELARLQPQRIVILGGPGAVSADVELALDQYTTGPVQRRWGLNRWQTAIAISQAGWPAGSDTLYIATGDNFPDALAGGPAARAWSAPLLLVPGTETQLPPEVQAEILRLAPRRIHVLGGPGVVREELLVQMRLLIGAP